MLVEDDDAAGEERTLAALLERGHVEPALLRRIVADVADQVAALHAAGSAHGAVHAETVLVRADGGATLLEPAVAQGVRRPPPGPGRVEPPQPSQEDDLGALRGLLAAEDGRVPLATTAAGLAELLREERPVTPATPDHRFAAIGSAVLVGTAGLGLGAALVASAVAGASGPTDEAAEAPAVGGPSSSALPASTSTVPQDVASSPAPASSAGPRTAAARPVAAPPRTASGGSAPTDADRAEPRRHRRSSASPSARAATPAPTPTPTSSVAPDPTSTPDPPSSPTPTPAPTDGSEPTPAPTPTSSPEPTPTPPPASAPAPEPTPSPTDEPSASPTGEPTAGPTAAG